jgi:hypothetical protein
VQRNKYRATLRICYGGAIIEGGIVVATACLHDLKALRFERPPHLRGEIKHDFALSQSAAASRSWIRSPVCRIKYDHVQSKFLWRRGGIWVLRRRGSNGRGATQAHEKNCPQENLQSAGWDWYLESHVEQDIKSSVPSLRGALVQDA